MFYHTNPPVDGHAPNDPPLNKHNGLLWLQFMSFTIYLEKSDYKGGAEMPKKKTYSSKRRQPQVKNNKLPIFLVIGGALILLIAAFFAFQKKSTPFTPEITGGPSLKTDKEKVDLGDVKLGNPVQVSFILTNVGDQPLRFSEVPYIEVKEGC